MIDNLLQIVLEEQKTQFNHDFHTSCEPKLSFGISTSTISPCSKTWLWLTAPRLFLPQIVLLVTKIQVLDSLTIKPIIKNYFQSHKILHMKKKLFRGQWLHFAFFATLTSASFLSKASHCARGRWWLVNACTLLTPNSFPRTKRTFGEQQEHLANKNTKRLKIKTGVVFIKVSGVSE